MDVEFEDDTLQALESDPNYSSEFELAVVKGFRKCMQIIRNAPDERDFYALKSLHFEKLKGNRDGQYSMRLNLQWRLIFRFVRRNNGKTVVIISISDYH